MAKAIKPPTTGTAEVEAYLTLSRNLLYPPHS